MSAHTLIPVQHKETLTTAIYKRHRQQSATRPNGRRNGGAYVVFEICRLVKQMTVISFPNKDV